MSQNRMTETDVRRARIQCYCAAAIFIGCAILLFVLPLAPALRAVAGGFNLVVAIAVVLYARSLRAED
jgi:hypothetical protein